jgi:hypothetical protein
MIKDYYLVILEKKKNFFFYYYFIIFLFNIIFNKFKTYNEKIKLY